MSLPGDRAATELLRAVNDALNLPDSAIDGDAAVRRASLLETRSAAARDAIRMALVYGDEAAMRNEAEHLRIRIDQAPVTYPLLATDPRPRPDVCLVCGPGCCSPVAGIHTSCPGPVVVAR